MAYEGYGSGYGGGSAIGNGMRNLGGNIMAFSGMMGERSNYRKYIDGLAKLGESGMDSSYAQDGTSTDLKMQQAAANGSLDWNSKDSWQSFQQHGGGGSRAATISQLLGNQSGGQFASGEFPKKSM